MLRRHSYHSHSKKSRQEEVDSGSRFGAKGVWKGKQEKQDKRKAQSLFLDSTVEAPVASENFTLDDTYDFEKWIDSVTSILQDSSVVVTDERSKHHKKSGTDSKTRKGLKRNAWASYTKLRNTIPAFLKCLKGHPNHHICHPVGQSDSAAPTTGSQPHHSRKQIAYYPNENQSHERIQQQLLEKKNKICELENKLEDYSNKLAKEMEKKISADESSVENISISNRPMTIADEYVMMQSNEWLGAKRLLDDACPNTLELQKLTLLCDMLDFAKKSSHSLHMSVMENIRREIFTFCDPKTLYEANWVGQESSTRKRLAKGEACISSTPKESTLPIEFANMFGDYLRATSKRVDLHGMCQEVEQKLSGCKYIHKTPFKKVWDSVKSAEPFQNYLHAACRLTWKMALQRPAMVLDFTSDRKGSNLQDIHWNSQVVDKAKVCVVFPILTHGNHVMAKGKIYLYKTE